MTHVLRQQVLGIHPQGAGRRCSVRVPSLKASALGERAGLRSSNLLQDQERLSDYLQDILHGQWLVMNGVVCECSDLMGIVLAIGIQQVRWCFVDSLFETSSLDTGIRKGYVNNTSAEHDAGNVKPQGEALSSLPEKGPRALRRAVRNAQRGKQQKARCGPSRAFHGIPHGLSEEQFPDDFEDCPIVRPRVTRDSSEGGQKTVRGQSLLLKDGRKLREMALKVVYEPLQLRFDQSTLGALGRDQFLRCLENMLGEPLCLLEDYSREREISWTALGIPSLHILLVLINAGFDLDVQIELVVSLVRNGLRVRIHGNPLLQETPPAAQISARCPTRSQVPAKELPRLWRTASLTVLVLALRVISPISESWRTWCLPGLYGIPAANATGNPTASQDLGECS